MHHGYEDFVRVGCLKRIAKPILKHTLRETGSDDKLDKDSLKELNEMLRTTRDQAEIREIKAAIAQVCEDVHIAHLCFLQQADMLNDHGDFILLQYPNVLMRNQ